MAHQVWVTRVVGLGPDGAEVLRREMHDSPTGPDARQVAAVTDWVESMAGVESVREERRRYY